MCTTARYISNPMELQRREDGSLWGCYGWFDDRSGQLYSNTVHHAATRPRSGVGFVGVALGQCKHIAQVPSVPAGRYTRSERKKVGQVLMIQSQIFKYLLSKLFVCYILFICEVKTVPLLQAHICLDWICHRTPLLPRDCRAAETQRDKVPIICNSWLSC